jgi:exosortase
MTTALPEFNETRAREAQERAALQIDRAYIKRHAAFAAFSVGLGLLGFGTIWKLTAISLDWQDDTTSYIVLIPFISAFLIYSDRNRIFSNLRTSILPALAGFAVAAAFLYIRWAYGTGFQTIDQLALSTAALISALLGSFLLFYGSAAFKAGLFPLLFLALSIPFPSKVIAAVVHFLQMGSADTVSLLFMLTGTPAYQENTIFVLPGVTIEVAEACSGIRSTLAIVIITLIAAHFVLRSNWRKVVLLALVIPISLFKNAVRIAVLTLLAIHWDRDFLEGRLHRDGGFLFMLLGLALMYPILLALARSEKKTYVDSGVRL